MIVFFFNLLELFAFVFGENMQSAEILAPNAKLLSYGDFIIIHLI